MHYPLIISLFVSVIFLISCDPTATDEPKIFAGHEWNASAGVVADTTSLFKANDVIVIQMDNGKPFFAPEVEFRVYQGEVGDRVLFKRAIPVRNTDNRATIKGPESKPVTAREIFRTSTPGFYRVAFAIGDSVLLEKKLELAK
ncbi:hypothetical protein AGMMS49938_04830 [Fibrobacterales bacterium]|nr:hypothetical protein AGMMS49938_04830 [Fibrobacterales bacterium]